MFAQYTIVEVPVLGMIFDLLQEFERGKYYCPSLGARILN